MLAKFRKPIIITLLVVLAISYYIYLTRRDVNNTDKMASESKQLEVLSRDMSKNYPKDYYEVVEYFAKIQKTAYKEKLSEDEIVGCVQHLRALISDELLLQKDNDYDSYLARFKEEIERYRENDRYINDFQIQKRRGIKQYVLDGKSFAEVHVKYFIREGGKLIVMYEKYTLRKESDSKWKILYWEISDGTEMKDE